MATAHSISDSPPPPAPAGPGLLVLLAAMPPEQLESVLANLASTFPPEALIVASPDGIATASYPNLRIVPIPAANPAWTLTAVDFVNAYQLAEKNQARTILMLGPGSGSLHPSALRRLADAASDGSTDLAVPCYDMPPHAGLVNSAILYPLTRALFASRVRFPLAIDLGLSLRMAERTAAAAQRFTALNHGDALLWPVNEASMAGFAIHEIDVGPRAQPQPASADLSTILPLVTGSLFADIDAKAAFWQRSRQLPAARNPAPVAPWPDGAADIAPMLDAFRLGYTNLQEIWSLVLPPNTLLGLKRLSAATFSAL